MFKFFKCKHPVDSLVVEKDATVIEHDKDFEYIDYHFVCINCGEKVKIGYAKMIGGVEAFIKRGVESI